jgi:hypothetical protein
MPEEIVWMRNVENLKQTVQHLDERLLEILRGKRFRWIRGREICHPCVLQSHRARDYAIEEIVVVYRLPQLVPDFCAASHDASSSSS